MLSKPKPELLLESRIVLVIPQSSDAWALNSAVECHLHTVEVIGSNPIAPTKHRFLPNLLASIGRSLVLGGNSSPFEKVFPGIPAETSQGLKGNRCKKIARNSSKLIHYLFEEAEFCFRTSLASCRATWKRGSLAESQSKSAKFFGHASGALPASFAESVPVPFCLKGKELSLTIIVISYFTTLSSIGTRSGIRSMRKTTSAGGELTLSKPDAVRAPGNSLANDFDFVMSLAESNCIVRAWGYLFRIVSATLFADSLNRSVFSVVLVVAQESVVSVFPLAVNRMRIRP